jgi:hypothetical protein
MDKNCTGPGSTVSIIKKILVFRIKKIILATTLVPYRKGEKLYPKNQRDTDANGIAMPLKHRGNSFFPFTKTSPFQFAMQ